MPSEDGSLPTLEMLLEEIQRFEDLKKKHKDAKKPAASAPLKPVAKAAPEASQPNANA